MEESQLSSNGTELDNPALCSNCHEKEFIAGDRSMLCSDCRAAFLSSPVPRWLKILSLLIVLILALSFYRLRKAWPGIRAMNQMEKAIASGFSS